MKKLFFVMMAFAVLSALPVRAFTEELVFVTTVFPPSVIEENGKLTGMDVDTVREVCKRLGLDVNIKSLPWIRAVKYVKEGTAAAIFTPKKTEERAEFMYFSSEPLNSDKLVIIAPKVLNLKITKIDDLKGKRVGVVRDYSYGSEFDSYQGLRKVGCDHDEQLITILDRGRIDLGVGDEKNLKYIIKNQKAKKLFETVYVLSEDPSYIGFSKKALGEKGKVLAEKFSEVLRQLKKEGFIEKVESKYF